MHRLVIAILCLAACDEEPPDPPPKGDQVCEDAADPALEVSHYGTFEALGDVVYCGIPPQGGAPYAPFGLRVRGVHADPTGAIPVNITVVDTQTDEVLSDADFFQRFLCANAGESDGWLVGSEFHPRFFDNTVDDLHERQVEITFRADGVDGAVAEMSMVVDLDCIAGA